MMAHDGGRLSGLKTNIELAERRKSLRLEARETFNEAKDTSLPQQRSWKLPHGTDKPANMRRTGGQRGRRRLRGWLRRSRGRMLRRQYVTRRRRNKQKGRPRMKLPQRPRRDGTAGGSNYSLSESIYQDGAAGVF
jgi:hypothetical protein